MIEFVSFYITKLQLM